MMKSFLFHALLSVLANSFAIFFTESVIKDAAVFSVQGNFAAYLLIGFIIGLINLFIKPILQIISLPLIFVTGGLLLIVINALVLFFTDQILEVINLFGADLQVSGWKSWLAASVIFGIMNYVLHIFTKRRL